MRKRGYEPNPIKPWLVGWVDPSYAMEWMGWIIQLQKEIEQEQNSKNEKTVSSNDFWKNFSN